MHGLQVGGIVTLVSDFLTLVDSNFTVSRSLNSKNVARSCKESFLVLSCMIAS